jgi:hypothetical protein
MAQTKWTEGDWHDGSHGYSLTEPTSPAVGGVSVPITVGQKTVAIATGGCRAEAEDNAALIASAPEMYAALDRLTMLVSNIRELYGSEVANWIIERQAYQDSISALAHARRAVTRKGERHVRSM